MKNYIKASFACLAIIALSSCKSLKPYNNSDLRKISSAKELDGTFSNTADSVDAGRSHTILELVDFRKEIKNESKIKKVKIYALDDHIIQFSFIDINGKVYPYNSKYVLEKNGFIRLKNHQFRLTGLPYIFGGYKINKVEIGLNKQDQLILNTLQADEGAILLILPATLPTDHFTYKYEKEKLTSN